MGSKSIVFLDASTVDFGDIDLTPIASLGNLLCYPITRPEETVERSKNADIIITNKVVFTKYEIDKLRCSLIAVAATGFNTIDVKAAAKKGIAVANVPSYSREAVAQLTICFILSLAYRLIEYNTASHDGRWSRSPIFTMGSWPTMCVAGKILGIMGYGDIGKRVAELAQSFGMKTIAYKRNEGQNHNIPIPRKAIDEFCKESDFITIHMPLNDDTFHLINKNFLTKMKPTAYLINMARGPIVDTQALAWALHNNIIAGAALDVLEKEPPSIDDPILQAPNCIITPHMAWASKETRQALIYEIAENIKAHYIGKKRNIVNDYP